MRATFFLSFSCMMLIQTASWSCNVPVYRYALERWTPDMFEIIVFYENELPETIKAWQKKDTLHDNVVNYVIFPIPTNDIPPDEYGDLHKKLTIKAYPYIVVRPFKNPHIITWHGPLANPDAQSIADSPLRQTIANDLMKNHTATWLLMESGNQEKDDAAFALLESELKRLEETLVLPEQDSDAVELSIQFSAYRLNADDQDEKFLTHQLLQSEEDLFAYQDEPKVFPVFGRGRALYALIGKGISPDTIQAAAEFLCGACSCQVKELNPGVDLLMVADWDSAIQHSLVSDYEMSLVTGGAESAGADSISSASTAISITNKISGGNMMLASVYLTLGFLFILNAVYLVYRSRKKAAQGA